MVSDTVVLKFLKKHKWEYNLVTFKAICDWCEFRPCGKRTNKPDLCEDCARELDLLW